METQIQCPNCGSILGVTIEQEPESVSVICPVCKVVNKYTNYIKVQEEPINRIEDETQYFNDGRQMICPMAKLILCGSNKKYTLKQGRNCIGRKATTSTADVQIETDDRSMSRSHAIIDVHLSDNGKYTYYLTNDKNKNVTYVGNDLLESGDCVVISVNDKIKMGKTILQLEYPDISEDKTVISNNKYGRL